MSDAAVPNTERLNLAPVSWTRSPQIGELVKALALAQLKFEPIFKENDNPQFHSKYADLSAIIAATQKHLAANGLVVMQLPNIEGQMLHLTTILAHTSEQFIENVFSLPATMRDQFHAQSVGSAMTYARRYALQAILGVAADVDDDATEAVGGGSKEAAKAVAEKKIAEYKAKAPVKEEPKGVVISRPEALNGHYIAVSGMIEAPLMVKFFSDTESKRFQDANGKPYWRVPSEYEKDLLSLCTQLQVKVS